MLVILYEFNGMNKYVLIHTPLKNVDKAIQDFRDTFPARKITYVFHTDDDKLTHDRKEATDFDRLCTKYGFNPADYKRRYKDPSDGRVRELVGFATNRRKYVCRLRDISDGSYILTTKHYATNMLANYEVPIE